MEALEGLEESSLYMNWYNGTSGMWEVLNTAMGWVYGTGVNTANSDSYSGYVWANVSHFSYYGIGGTPTPTSTSTSSSGGGGGGGGGGGVSGENASNILVKEKYDKHIFKDIVTSYVFTNKSNPVKFVNITGNTSAGEINAAVEVLRGTSTLVNVSPPGIVYKNVNIWVGTSGFATPRNIKKATVEFGVDKNWITDNSIASINLLRYDTNNKEWVSLPTNKVRENVTENYYQGETDRFSSFAIAGEKSSFQTMLSPATTAPLSVSSTPEASESPANSSNKTVPYLEKAPNWILTLILVVIVSALSLKLFTMRKKK